MVEFWRIVVSLGVPGLALGIFYMLYRNFGRSWKIPAVPQRFAASIVIVYMLLVSGLVFHALTLWAPAKPKTLETYQIRITVVGPNGLLVDDARVWSARGGEGKKVEGGWEIELPAFKRPADGQLPVFAVRAADHLQGAVTVTLADTPAVSGTIRLAQDRSSRVRGVVTDGQDRPLAGVRVSVEGYAAEAVVTTVTGEFELHAHAPEGEPVILRAERNGLPPMRQQHPAGDALAYLRWESP